MSTVMKISPQGQIRIPKKVMQTLNIEKGDYVEVEIDRCIRGGDHCRLFNLDDNFGPNSSHIRQGLENTFYIFHDPGLGSHHISRRQSRQ